MTNSLTIPIDTKVYLLFGAKYIEVDGRVFWSVLNSGWQGTKNTMENIISHPETRTLGTIANPTDPEPPFETTIITTKKN